MKLKLSLQWKLWCKLRAEGDKLRAEGDKLRADRLWAEGIKLWAEGDRLWAEGSKLWAEGNRLWAEAVIKIHGNITIELIPKGDGYDCKLGNGELYKFTKEKVTLNSAMESLKNVTPIYGR